MLTTARLNADLAATLVAGARHGGVHDVVISPGSRSTPLALAFADAANEPGGPRLHVFTDERTAGFVALGLARATGVPSALVCTSGSAAAHYLPALIEASEDRVPLLVLTADRPAELHGCGASQTIDQQRLFGVHVRHARDLGSPTAPEALGSIATAVCRALAVARGPVPGPVHLNVPFREPLWAPGITGRPTRPPLALDAEAGPGEAAARLAPLVEAVRVAHRPVLVAGPLAPAVLGGPEVARRLLAAAARIGCPVLADATAQLRFVATPTPAIVAGEALLRAPPFVAAHVPDLVLRVGRAPTSRTALTFLAGLPGSTRVLHVDPHGDVHDPAHRAERVVTASPAALASALEGVAAETPVGSPRAGWARAWSVADATARAALATVCAEGFWEGGIARTIVESLPAGAALQVASSMPVRNVDAFAAAVGADHPVFANRGAAGIDGMVATAAGLALGRGGRVVLFCGDLALLHDVGSLLSTRGRALPLTIVVVDNGGGGIFGYLPIAEHPTAFERFFLTPPDADFAAIADAAGAAYHATETLSGLRAALQASEARPGVSLVVCRVDRATDVAKHREAWAAVEAAVCRHIPIHSESAGENT